MLARAPIHVQVSDESGEFVFVAPSNLSTPGANTRSARLRYWVNKPLREPVQGRLEIFSNVGHPTAFSSETKTPAVTTAPLADFIRALSDYDYQVPGASATPPLPSSLRRRVLVSLSNALSARKKNTPTAALEY
ncbi:hypothetical protein DIPPA_14226 [Diplonema papillatum]|nr:hypothetical protein DIPPA_14226 [Diplonema papillatum]